MYIYIFIYLNFYRHLFAYRYIYIYRYIYTCIYIYIYLHIYIYIYFYVYVFIFTYTVYTFKYAFTYIYIFIYLLFADTNWDQFISFCVTPLDQLHQAIPAFLRKLMCRVPRLLRNVGLWKHLQLWGLEMEKVVPRSVQLTTVFNHCIFTLPSFGKSPVPSSKKGFRLPSGPQWLQIAITNPLAAFLKRAGCFTFLTLPLGFSNGVQFCGKCPNLSKMAEDFHWDSG